MKKFVFELPSLDDLLLRMEKIESLLESINEGTNQIKSNGWLTTREAAIVLGVTPRTIQNYRDRGLIPFSQFGFQVRYREDDIQKFLMDHYVSPK